MKTKTDLIERYVYAVVRHLPRKMQADVDRELNGLISDMLEERGENANSPGRSIKDVLTELGPPEELALKYSNSERSALISGIYFLKYKQVLSIVLPIVAAVTIGLGILGFFAGEGFNVQILFLISLRHINVWWQLVEAAVRTSLMAFAAVTLVFAIMDYRKTALSEDDMLENLPDVPSAKESIGIFEPVILIALSIFTVTLFLGFPHVINAWVDGEAIPVFDIAVLRSHWLPIVAWGALGVYCNAMHLVDGWYTLRVTVITIVASILMAVCGVSIFINENVFNPEFISLMTGLFYGDASWIGRIFTQLNSIIVFIIIAAMLIDLVNTAVRFFRSRRASS